MRRPARSRLHVEVDGTSDDRFDLAEVADTSATPSPICSSRAARGRDLHRARTATSSRDITLHGGATNSPPRAARRRADDAALRCSEHESIRSSSARCMRNNQHDLARSLISTRIHRARPRAAGISTQPITVPTEAHPPQRPGRAMESEQDRDRRPQGLPLPRAGLRARRRPSPQAITSRMPERGSQFVHIEDVQDMVQEELMRAGPLQGGRRLHPLPRPPRRDPPRRAGSAAKHADDPPAELVHLVSDDDGRPPSGTAPTSASASTSPARPRPLPTRDEIEGELRRSLQPEITRRT